MTTSTSRSVAIVAAIIIASLVAISPASARGHIGGEPEPVVYTSDATVGTYDPIYPASVDGSWPSTVCVPNPAVGLDANWQNPHNAFDFGPAAHPWQGGAGFSANWINAWSDLNSRGPGGHSWTLYETPVSGTGDFVLNLLADNCSWVYIDGILVGFQDASTQPRTYPVSLNGDHLLQFIIFDGGGLAGGMFRLETNTGTEFADTDGDGLPDNSEHLHGTNPNNPDTDGDGFSDGEEVAAGSDPLNPNDTPNLPQIETGARHSCAFYPADGEVNCWGNNVYGQSEDYLEGDALAFAVGDYTNCVLLATGDTTCWGYNANALSWNEGDAAAVSVGYNAACVITTIQELYCYGVYLVGTESWTHVQTNPEGGEGEGGAPVWVMVSSYAYCYGLEGESTAYCYGWRIPVNELTPSTGEFDGTGGGNYAPCLLTTGGDVNCIDNNYNDVGQFEGYFGGDAVEADAHFIHGCALLESGSLSCWGGSDAVPPAGFGEGAVDVSAGGAHTCVVYRDGMAECHDWFLQDGDDSYATPDGRSGPAVVDSDDDGVADDVDNCPTMANSGQEDLDNDGIGDACDEDIDGDSVPNDADAFPTDPSESSDYDNDGIGDNADPDDDNDGVLDESDVCHGQDDTIDIDGDSIPDCIDPDTNDGPLGDLDFDGVNNANDNCVDTSNPAQGDLDGDGTGDFCDDFAGHVKAKAEGYLKDNGDKVKFNVKAHQHEGEDLKGHVKVEDKDAGFKVDLKDIGPVYAADGCGAMDGQPDAVMFTASGDGVEVLVCMQDAGKNNDDNHQFKMVCLTGCSYATTDNQDTTVDKGQVKLDIGDKQKS